MASNMGGAESLRLRRQQLRDGGRGKSDEHGRRARLTLRSQFGSALPGTDIEARLQCRVAVWNETVAIGCCFFEIVSLARCCQVRGASTTCCSTISMCI